MSVRSRPATLLAAASVVAGLVLAPGAAQAADITTNLTGPEMKVAMETVASATATAAAAGWKRRWTALAVTSSGQQWPYANTLTFDVEHHRMRNVTEAAPPDVEEEYLVAEGLGLYKAVNGAEDRAALDMMHRSAAKFQFIVDKTADLAGLTGQESGSPAGTALSWGRAATRIMHDDGSADYRIVSNPVTTILHVSAAAVLASVDMHRVDADGRYDGVMQYSYAPQTVTLPAASVTIDAADLQVGCSYRDMVARVSDAVINGARLTVKAAKGGMVTVAALRRTVRQEAAAVNKMTQVKDLVKVKDIPSGVRVYATNPWTRKTTATNVAASGRKVVVKKA